MGVAEAGCVRGSRPVRCCCVISALKYGGAYLSHWHSSLGKICIKMLLTDYNDLKSSISQIRILLKRCCCIRALPREDPRPPLTGCGVHSGPISCSSLSSASTIFYLSQHSSLTMSTQRNAPVGTHRGYAFRSGHRMIVLVELIN